MINEILKQLNAVEQQMLDLGNLVRAQRLSLNYSQKKVTDLAGCNRRSIMKLEGGQGRLSFRTVLKILDVLSLGDSLVLPSLIPSTKRRASRE